MMQSQDWKGMDGAIAWHLIDRHADNWNEAGQMMMAWLEANRQQAVVDTNVEQVREKLLQRSIVGLSKYGVTTERTDLSDLQWLRHAQEEAMDLAVYLEKIINAQSHTNTPA